MLISYLVAGTLIILVMWALGEMAAANPDSGAFSVYTAKAYGPVAGATVGWLWWLQLVVVIAAEALGAAGLLATIFPALPVWLMAFVFIVVLTGVNLTQEALSTMASNVGEESIVSRTGGAPTLAVGIAQIMPATARAVKAPLLKPKQYILSPGE